MSQTRRGAKRVRRRAVTIGAFVAAALVFVAWVGWQAFTPPPPLSGGLSPGSAAPSIARPATTGGSLSLDQLRGLKVVVYFYEESG